MIAFTIVFMSVSGQEHELDLGKRFLASGATEQWSEGGMSNLEYLLVLNRYAGRSFNDLTQYPVVPWVLAKWDTPELDLNDPATFRDLRLPVGALNPDLWPIYEVRTLKVHQSTSELQWRL